MGMSRLVEPLVPVDVPERPVLVAVSGEDLRRGRRVRVVLGVDEAGVQQPDVQRARNRRGIGLDQILGHVVPRIAAAVDDDVGRDFQRLRLLVRQDGDPGRHLQVARSEPGVVVVPQNDGHGDPGLGQPSKLTREVEAALEERIGVEDVARDDHERDLLREREPTSFSKARRVAPRMRSTGAPS